MDALRGGGVADVSGRSADVTGGQPGAAARHVRLAAPLVSLQRRRPSRTVPVSTDRVQPVLLL